MHYLSQFESIGDNCEFAFVQREHGVDEGALFKWSQTWHVSHLIDLLENRFQDAFVFENLVPVWDDMVIDARYRVLFHSDLRSEVIHGVRSWVERDHERRRDIHRQEQEKRFYLIDKFQQTAATGDKVFLFKSNGGISSAEETRLWTALRGYGPIRLLIVEAAKCAEQTGRVEQIGDTLFKGFIDRFAPYDRAHEFSPGAWESLCRNAISLIHGTQPAALPVSSAARSYGHTSRFPLGTSL